MTGQPLDLTSPEVTRRLLAHPRAWRERAVERLQIGSAEFVHRHRSLQCRPLFPLVYDLVAGAPPSATAFVVVPLGLLPKQPLLQFDVHGPAGPATLIRRPDIAAREALLLEAYAAEAGLPVSAALREVLPVLLSLTEGSWAAVKTQARRWQDPVDLYLRQGLTQPVSREQLSRLHAASRRAGAALDPYNELPADLTSAAESPFLIVPPLVEDVYVDGIDQAVLLVEEYADLVERAAQEADRETPNAAADFLTVLADYGRQWELMVLAELPLDRPFTRTFEHLDPAGVRGWRNTVTSSVVIADADSNHVTLSVDDPGARLVRVRGVHPRTGKPAIMGSTSRKTAELHAFYVWEVAVDFRVVLQSRLGVLRRVALGNVLLALVVSLVSASLAVRAPGTLSELTFVAGPTAAAASLLLLREPSTLASRLRLRYSALVAASVIALVSTATWRFLNLP